MDKAQRRVTTILNRAKNLGITPSDLNKYEIIQKYSTEIKNKSSKKKLIFYVLLIFVIFGYFQFNYVFSTSKCLLKLPQTLQQMFREPENCQRLCSNVSQIDRVSNITPEIFEVKYAYTGRPVVILDGTRDWSSLDTFTFTFFRDLYQDFEYEQEECQFFPYQTEFKSLSDALSMDENRAQFVPGSKHWYFGWSSCESDATNILREHYKKPYFLPKTSESTNFDWIFMGAPGKGAHLHVDNVHYPSWQAQLSGQKRWRLVPPPECYLTCTEIDVVVNPGEVIVVDTNRWYHQTFIVSNNISITIGSEFD